MGHFNNNSPCFLTFCVNIKIVVLFALFRAENLPLNEIDDLYLLDFVGPPGFVQEISTKVPRYYFLFLE